MLVVFRDYPKTLLVGTMIALATFVLFYLMTVFALSWGTTALGYTPPAVSADPAVRHPVLRADDSVFGGARRPPRPAAHAAVGDGGHRRVRFRDGAAADRRHRRRRWSAMALGWRSWASPTARSARRSRSCSPRPCATPAVR